MARILVTGATGNVGREVTAQLVSAGLPVRAFVRDARTPRLPEGAEVAEGDLSAPGTLERALTSAVEQITGTAARTFRAWATDHADDFR